MNKNEYISFLENALEEAITTLDECKPLIASSTNNLMDSLILKSIVSNPTNQINHL